MKKIINELVDKLSITGILIALFSTSLLLLLFNLLPLYFLKKIHLKEFLNNYNYIIIIAFFSTFFLLVYKLIINVVNKRKEKRVNDFYKKQQVDLLNDPDAVEILKKLYKNNPNPTMLKIHNQKVILLEQYGLIVKTTNQMPVSLWELSNPEFPYVLQPIAEKELRKKYFK